MIRAPAIMAAPAFVPIAAIGTPAEVAAPAVVPVVAAAAARSPAVVALPAAMPAIFVAAGFDNGRRPLGDLYGRYASGVGDCRVWRHSKSKRGETRGFKKRLH